LVIPCHASDSDIEVAGVIKEGNGDFLPGVLVVLKDSQENTIAYTTSNQNGIFRLASSKKSDITVIFSCLGFRKISVPLNKFKNGSTIILEEETFQLKEVTVRNPPIRINGDTLTYDVASFKDAKDRSIEDIIRKLPGISVSEEGRIYYNGEAINKFYIEDLDLLSGRYALASRNISPEDVTSINIYENHQSKRVLKDIEYSDKAAINLKLKNRSLLRPIGYAKIGTGLDYNRNCLWIGEAFGLLVSPKKQMLFSAKANNTGLSYTNEAKPLADGGLNNGSCAFGIYPLYPFGTADIPFSRFYNNRSVSTSANTIFRLDEYTNLNIIADYTDECINYNNSEAITYTTGDNENIIIRESAYNNPNPRTANFKLNLENNTHRRFISNIFSFIGHFNLNKYEIENEQSYFQKNSTGDYNVRNTLNCIFRISDCILDFKSDTQFSTTPVNRLSAYKNGDAFIMQNIKGYGIRNKEEIGYSLLINAKSYIGFKSTFCFNYDLFESSNGIPIQSITNNVNGYKITTTVEPLYQYKISNRLILNVSVPLRLNNLKFNDAVNTKKYKTDLFDYDFKSGLNYNTPFNLKTTWTIGRQNYLGDISDFIINPLYLTFRQVSISGNGNLSKKVSHYVTANFTYRNAIEGLFSSASCMYRHTTSNRLGSIDISNDENILSSLKNMDNTSRLINTTFSVSKKVFSWNTSFSFDCSYELLKKSVLRQQNTLNVDMSNFVCHFNINTNPIGNYLIALFDFKHSYTKQEINISDTGGRTNQTTINLTLTTNPIKSLELGTSLYYSRRDTDSNKASSSFFIDCNARYRIGAFDIELTAHNLTNTKEYEYTSIYDSDIYSYSFKLRPLEMTLTLRYSF